MSLADIGPLVLNAANTRANFMLQMQQLKEGIRTASLARFNAIVNFKLETDAAKSAEKKASRKKTQGQLIEFASIMALAGFGSASNPFAAAGTPLAGTPLAGGGGGGAVAGLTGGPTAVGSFSPEALLLL